MKHLNLELTEHELSTMIATLQAAIVANEANPKPINERYYRRCRELLAKIDPVYQIAIREKYRKGPARHRE